MDQEPHNTSARRQILLSSAPVPRVSIGVLSVALHLAVFALFVVYWRLPRPHILPQKLQAVQVGGASPAFQQASSRTSPLVYPRPLPRSSRKAGPAIPRKTGPESSGDSTEQVRTQARRETIALVQNFKFRQIYGFSPGEEYHLAIQTAGRMPAITPAELPPHYEQYLIVEVTIGTDGHVVDTRLTTGMADAAVVQKILSAIREFKYSPARRGDVPIPSQIDIVIHIPT